MATSTNTPFTFLFSQSSGLALPINAMPYNTQHKIAFRDVLAEINARSIIQKGLRIDSTDIMIGIYKDILSNADGRSETWVSNYMTYFVNLIGPDVGITFISS